MIGAVSYSSTSNELGWGKLAFAMNRDIDYGIARAWEIVTESEVEIKIFVFRKLEKAIAWLKE